ncbi:MAG: hypothetical protein M1836_004749 [Candelina mexicana]|nr:MAG: hypothetical protein M1836_004749 [Candelina mexicana]
MIHYSTFTSSKLAVSQNAVKSILFRCAALLLQFAVFKVLALLAFKRKAFTSYLMFTEDYIQQGLFVISRKFIRGGLLVLFFAVFFTGAGFYDTLLWGLDAPGYIAKNSNVSASSLVDKLLSDPGYIVFTSGKPGQVASLDEHLADNIGTNLFKAGVNFTLTEDFDHGTPQVVTPTKGLAESGGPRIWLDQEGLSVSPDSFITFAPAPDGNLTNAFDCPKQPLAANSVYWNCTYNNSYSLSIVRDEIIGRPEIHWDDSSDSQYQSQYLRPGRGDNPWTSLGTGGDTALMKQVFTVTKGRNRHTFMETAFKIAMVTDYNKPFPIEQITDLVKRSWSADPAQQTAPAIGKIAKSIYNARVLNSSFMFGSASADGYSVAQSSWELMNPEALPGNDSEVVYTLLRISAVNITLIRSDVLPQPVQPAAPCDNKFFQNLAKGGKIQGTDCYKAGTGNMTNARFFGQLDTSTVFIMNGILGDGSVNSSAGSLNQQGYDWVVKNEARMNNLILSRGMILGLDPAFVTVQTSKVTPAISYLQVILIALAVILAAISWLALTIFATAHYSSSFLHNLLAITNTTGATNGEETSRKPGYMRNVPEIQLGQEGNRVIMETVTGVYRHDGEANAMTPHAFDSTNNESKDAHEYNKQDAQVTAQWVAPTPSPGPTDRDPFFAEPHAR